MKHVRWDVYMSLGRRNLILGVKLPTLFIVCMFLLCVNTTAAHAATVISTSITSNTMWMASSSPYVINENINVEPGVTLTIEAGTVMKLSGAIAFYIDGTLDALGTADDPVYFTSFKDDAVGGDTNENGSSTSPAAQDWKTLQFRDGSVANLQHVVVRYAGYRRSGVRPSPGIYNTGGILQIDNSQLTDNNQYNIGQTSGSLTVRNSELRGSRFGVAILGGRTNLDLNTFSGHTSTAVFIAEGNDDVTITDNNFVDNNTAIDINHAVERNFYHRGNTAIDGYQNGIVSRGSVAGTTIFNTDSIPYIISGSGGLDASGLLVIDTNANFSVAESGSLIIIPGAVIKFSGTGTNLLIEGSVESRLSMSVSVKTLLFHLKILIFKNIYLVKIN